MAFKLKRGIKYFWVRRVLFFYLWHYSWRIQIGSVNVLMTNLGGDTNDWIRDEWDIIKDETPTMYPDGFENYKSFLICACWVFNFLKKI